MYKSRSTYIKSVLSVSEANNLETHITSHPQLRGRMYIPLNTAIVVKLYKESPTSMSSILTELYTTPAKVLLRRYLCGHTNLEGISNSFTKVVFDVSVPDRVQKYFIELCHLAYKGIVESDYVQVIFGESNLPAGFDNLGFMDPVTELYAADGAVSLHLTFQEFLAAVHISNMSPE